MPRVYRWILLPLLASVSCGDTQLPTAPTPVAPVAITAASEPTTPAQPTPVPRPVNVVITYAQGTSTQSLHVQWTGELKVYPIEVRYAREATDTFALIDSFGHERAELQYYPKPGGGRYTVTVAGVTSRVMFLDGEVRDSNAGGSGSGNGGNSPSSPANGPSTPTNRNGGDAGGSGGDSNGGSGASGGSGNGDSGSSSGSSGNNSCQEDHNKGHGNGCRPDADNPGNGNKKPKGKK